MAAQTIRSALGQSHTPLGTRAAPAPAPRSISTPRRLAGALGIAGKINGGVYQVSVPRKETIREGGNEVPPSMGVATAINFQPTAVARPQSPATS